MLVGYARTSTAEQLAGLDAQVRDLEAAGCERVWREQVSSVAKRAELDKLIEFVREGDTVIVTKLDRLARSMADLWRLVEEFERKKVRLRILAIGLDSATASGRLMVNVFGAVAQFEREIMLERQREGIAAAKAEEKYKGRVPTARRQSDEVRSLAALGVKKTEIARRLHIGERSVYRILNEAAS
jgi:DNA invertase Pin-like site-specific DNA recombinase